MITLLKSRYSIKDKMLSKTMMRIKTPKIQLHQLQEPNLKMETEAK
jgi:hypothetical protein